jgi:2-dehydro-3-deoxygluconokinase
MSRLATVGETMLRYSPPGDGRLETADAFEVHVGGAESNVAVAAARLGVDACWLSRLPEGRLGRRIARRLRREGVEVAVDWTEGGRVGTYYLEPGGRSRRTEVVYDRTETPVRAATPRHLATERVERADALHVSGITPALSETLAETTEELLALAGEADTTRVFDLNYRRKLWSPAQARATLTDLLPAVDTLVVAERDAATVLDRADEPGPLVRDLAAEYDLGTVVLTRGEAGATALRDGDRADHPTFDAADSHPVGTGDAFVGGFLAADLRGEGLRRALATGAATAALKREIPGDLATVDPAEVERLLADGADGIAR